MAYHTSEAYKQFIYDEDSIQNIDFIVNDTPINKDFVKSIKYKDSIFESDSFILGSAIPKQFEIELNKDFLSEIEDFTELKIIFNLELEDGTIEEVPMGNYIVIKADENSEDSIKYTLRDYMEKFDGTIDFSNLVPCTRFELLKEICNSSGVELENLSIINGNEIVNNYDNTIPVKTYISFIAERAGGFAKITRDNKLVIKSFDKSDINILPSDLLGDFTINEQKSITKVVYENGIQKFEKGTDDGETIFLSQESPFSCSQLEIDNLYDVLKNITYQTFDAKIWGDPSIDSGDIIKINNIVSFAQMDWDFGNGFYGNYKTVLNKTSKISNVSKLSATQKFRRLKSIIDEQAGVLEIINEKVDGQNKQLADFKIALDSISLTVKSTTQEVKDLADSLEIFSVELSQYNLLIPTDYQGYPKNTSSYDVFYYAYFKGKQVSKIKHIIA